MGNETTDLLVDVAVLKSRVDAMEKGQAGRATREWAIVMTILGLLATIIVKQLGWLS